MHKMVLKKRVEGQVALGEGQDLLDRRDPQGEVDPHGHDEHEEHRPPVAEIALGQNVGRGPGDDQAHRRRHRRHLQAVHQGPQHPGIDEEPREPRQGELAMVIGEGEVEDHHHRKYHENRQEQGVGHRQHIFGQGFLHGRASSSSASTSRQRNLSGGTTTLTASPTFHSHLSSTAYSSLLSPVTR